MFNQRKWSQLLKKAQGNMSLNEFSKLTGVNKASLSDYVNEQSSSQPKYSTIEKIVNSCPDLPIPLVLSAAGYDLLLNTENPVDDLARDITDLLILKGFVDPDKPMSVEDRNDMVEFISKCLQFRIDT